VQQASEVLNLKQAMGVFRRRIPLIVLCVVVVAGAAFAFSRHQAKKYTATASLAFSNSPLSQEVAGLPANSSGVSVLAQQATDLELVKLGDMAAKTAHQLGHGLTELKVSESVSVAGQGESGVINVSATASSPVIAAAIANIYTRQFVKEQKLANSQYFKAALALVHRQLAALSPQQRVGADGLELQDRAQTLGLLSELNEGNVKVAEEAVPPTSPSSPKTSRNTVIGGVLGLFIGLALAFLLEPLDRRMRTPGDLEEIYGLPLLGTVPESKALSGGRAVSKGATLPFAEAEAFSLIRAHLRFFNVDRDLHTVVIASAASGDGKTTIARHLAEAAARSGAKVLLLELDLRGPQLARGLGIQPGPGVAEVLIGASRMDEAIQSVDLGVSPDERIPGRTLDVLVAGAVLPPNPGELLESNSMEAILAQAKSVYDLVVIDTPPLTAVSDAFPLLTKVDGVIIIGWVEHSRRDVAEQLHQTLANSGAPLLGVIANGSKSGDSSPYPRYGKSSPSTVSANAAISPSEELVTGTKA
jgi:polysaccharide biosynthesis transport protein